MAAIVSASREYKSSTMRDDTPKLFRSSLTIVQFQYEIEWPIGGIDISFGDSFKSLSEITDVKTPGSEKVTRQFPKSHLARTMFTDQIP